MTIDVIYGSALWYSETKVNVHFLAERLARETPVLYVESIGSRPPGGHEWRRALRRLGRSLRPLRRVGERLWVFSPLPLPVYRGVGVRLNSAWVGWQVRTLLTVRRWSTAVCWIFHPMGYGVARRVRPGGVVYYCVDDYAANPGVDSRAIAALERDVATLADVTIVTGEPLATRLRFHATTLRVLPNVADTELFTKDFSAVGHAVLDALDAIPRPRLGYVGNLAAYKSDLDLLSNLARRRTDWSIVLVGPRNYGDPHGTVGEVKLPPNVRVLGAVAHALVPAVIDRFDVCLLPAARHRVMQASFPLKFFEYLLRGKPVVSRRLPALEPYREWYWSAETADEFVAAVENAVAPDELEMAEARRRFAAGFGWEERRRELLALREDVLGVERATGNVQSVVG